MTAISYKLSDIPCNPIAKILNEFSQLVTSKTTYNITAVYIIGSSVQPLITDTFNTNNDIDIAFFVEAEIQRGEQILNSESLNFITKTLQQTHTLKIGLYYNGKPRNPTGDLIFDIIPIKNSDVTNRFPQVLIDMSNHDNIHIGGKPLLTPLMNTPVTPEIIVERLNLTQRYLDREISDMTETSHFIDYIVKCLNFALEMAFNFKTKKVCALELLLSLRPSNKEILELQNAANRILFVSQSKNLTEVLSAFSSFRKILTQYLYLYGFLCK